MSSVPPPIQIVPIFDPSDYAEQLTSGLSVEQADTRYLKLAGGTETGPVVFQSSTTFQNSTSYTANNTSLAFTGTGQQILAASGSLTIPSISFYSDSTSGLYLPSSAIIGFICNSIERLRISASLITSTNPINLPSGSNTAPAVQVGATGVGMYSSAANTLNFATNSVNRLGITDTQISPNVPIRNIDGTTASVAYGFANQNAGTGMTNNGTNRIAMCVSGSVYSQWASGYNDNLVQMRNTSGSAASPSIVSRTSGQDTTGLYWAAGPTLNISVNAVRRANITDTSLQLNGVSLDANGNNILNAPQVGNAAGNLELRMDSTGAGGTFTITGGTGLLSGTSGGNSGQHLVLIINGVSYKIALLNP